MRVLGVLILMLPSFSFAGICTNNVFSFACGPTVSDCPATQCLVAEDCLLINPAVPINGYSYYHGTDQRCDGSSYNAPSATCSDGTGAPNNDVSQCPTQCPSGQVYSTAYQACLDPLTCTADQTYHADTVSCNWTTQPTCTSDQTYQPSNNTCEANTGGTGGTGGQLPNPVEGNGRDIVGQIIPGYSGYCRTTGGSAFYDGKPLDCPGMNYGTTLATDASVRSLQNPLVDIVKKIQSLTDQSAGGLADISSKIGSAFSVENFSSIINNTAPLHQDLMQIIDKFSVSNGWLESINTNQGTIIQKMDAASVSQGESNNLLNNISNNLASLGNDVVHGFDAVVDELNYMTRIISSSGSGIENAVNGTTDAVNDLNNSLNASPVCTEKFNEDGSSYTDCVSAGSVGDTSARSAAALESANGSSGGTGGSGFPDESLKDGAGSDKKGDDDSFLAWFSKATTLDLPDYDYGKFLPKLPQSSACTYEVHRTVHGKAFDLAPCAALSPLRSILAWVFSVLGGFLVFRILFKHT